MQPQGIFKAISKKKNLLPEDDWQPYVHFDPDGIKVCSIYSHNFPVKQEHWLSHWGHFISSQEDLLALGAHRVGSCHLAE